MREYITIVENLDEANFAQKIAFPALAAGALAFTSINAPKTDKSAENSISQLHDKSKDHATAAVKKKARILALTMWAEARSDGKEAMRAVGHVVMNRLHSERKFGNSIEHVVLKRKAFSCWNPSDPNRKAMKAIPHMNKDSLEYKRFKEAMQIAMKIITGRDTDPTEGSLFYHTKQITPYWAVGIKPLKSIANHVFYDKDHKSEE